MSLPASVATSAAPSASGVSAKPARMSTPSRTTSSWARRLATSGFGPPVSLRMISIFLPATSSPFFGDVEVDAGLELVRRVGEGARVGQDDADLEGVLRDGGSGPGEAEAERGGGCGPGHHVDVLPVVAAGVRAAASCAPRGYTRAARLKPRGMRTAAVDKRRRGGQAARTRRRERGGSNREMKPQELASAAGGDPEHGRDAQELADRRLHLSGGAERVHQLARRAARLAGSGRALRPVAPHGGADDRGARRLRDAAGAGAEQLRQLPGQPGEALRRLRPFGARDRRRDPVPPGGGAVPDRGPGADGQLGRVPRPHRWLGRHARPGRPLAVAARAEGRGAAPLPLPDPGAERAAAAREAERRAAARDQVLPHGRDLDRRAEGAGAAARDVGGARARGLGAVRGGRGGPRHHRRGRARVRPAAGRVAGLFHQHAGIGVDSLAAAGGLYRGGDEGLPRVAAGGRLRGERVDRRQLRRATGSRTTTSRPTTSATGRS